MRWKGLQQRRVVPGPGGGELGLAAVFHTIQAGGGRLSFWMASAAVFFVNALISVARSSWMLATLQAMTAVLATLAAIEEWAAKR